MFFTLSSAKRCPTWNVVVRNNSNLEALKARQQNTTRKGGANVHVHEQINVMSDIFRGDGLLGNSRRAPGQRQMEIQTSVHVNYSKSATWGCLDLCSNTNSTILVRAAYQAGICSARRFNLY